MCIPPPFWRWGWPVPTRAPGPPPCLRALLTWLAAKPSGGAQEASWERCALWKSPCTAEQAWAQRGHGAVAEEHRPLEGAREGGAGASVGSSPHCGHSRAPLTPSAWPPACRRVNSRCSGYQVCGSLSQPTQDTTTSTPLPHSPGARPWPFCSSTHGLARVLRTWPGLGPDPSPSAHPALPMSPPPARAPLGATPLAWLLVVHPAQRHIFCHHFLWTSWCVPPQAGLEPPQAPCVCWGF